MRFARVVVLFLAVGIVSAEFSLGQEKKDDPKATKKDDSKEGKLKGQLPQNWGKLGLTDDQKQQVYKAQAKYRGEIEKLEAKIAELKGEQRKEMEKVLTAEQKKRLQEILTGKAPADK
jgi:Spy/CpxP family protein refolding chaperone